ncbi:hypothetical protein [Oryza sativa Japonica Group]|uniref:Uncharacterized protein P0034C09.47 n=1 Tax=Oryza sativa subsp. japonica TaxID=39947 RepID=Q5N7Q1_ORYSJ|nr:hypothetical protein [Oryza sativa Japonica Group]
MESGGRACATQVATCKSPLQLLYWFVASPLARVAVAAAISLAPRLLLGFGIGIRILSQTATAATHGATSKGGGSRIRTPPPLPRTGESDPLTPKAASASAKATIAALSDGCSWIRASAPPAPETAFVAHWRRPPARSSPLSQPLERSAAAATPCSTAALRRRNAAQHRRPPPPCRTAIPFRCAAPPSPSAPGHSAERRRPQPPGRSNSFVGLPTVNPSLRRRAQLLL